MQTSQRNRGDRHSLIAGRVSCKAYIDTAGAVQAASQTPTGQSTAAKWGNFLVSLASLAARAGVPFGACVRRMNAIALVATYGGVLHGACVGECW